MYTTNGGSNWTSLTYSGAPDLTSISVDGLTGNIYVVGKAVGTTNTVLDITTITKGNIPSAVSSNIASSTNLNFMYCNLDYDEIDIFEMVPGRIEGCSNNPNNGTYLTNQYMTCNYGDGHNQPSCSQTVGQSYKLPGNADFSSGFHKYGLEWSPSKLIYYFDDQVITTKPNLGFQASTGTGGMLSQQSPIIFDLAISWYDKWQDRTDWPANTSITPNVDAGNYDPTSIPNSQGHNYWDYFNPSILGGPPGGYSGDGTSISSTTNGTNGASMQIKSVSYYKLKQSQCSTGNPVFTQLSTTLNNYDLHGYNNGGSYSGVQKSITINNSTNGGSSVTMPSTSPNVLRASSYIEIDGDLTVPLGTEMYLDVNPCY